MKKVSVIIPVYNNGPFVEKCLRSIMNQSYENLQIIVIDDGSTDDSAITAACLQREDRRIVLIRQKNSGVGAARNAGLDAACGSYVTFVDGDDWISRNYIRRYVRRIEESGADLVIGGLDFVTEQNKCISRLVPDEYVRYTREEWPMRISAVCSHFYRRSLWETPRYRFSVDRERGEDMAVSLYFAALCPKISVLPASGYYYVQHPSSAMHQFRGLKTWKLPYESLKNAIEIIHSRGAANSEKFHELFVLRIFATCYFELSAGADREKKKELCTFIKDILHNFYPTYYLNPLTSLHADVRVPFVQKAAVWLLIRLVRYHLLDAVSVFL